ncbi:MAG: hypothetical protein JW818_21430 [Pirellulales bacterium]|nr:hypothetical protein [Pirellulales bacterium]
MEEAFDPYRKWLGIPAEEQPPDHYRLLAIERFEDDPDVILNAADARMGHLKTFQAGRNAEHSQRLLNEIATAKLCLLNPSEKAAYDEQLRHRLAQQQAPPPPITTTPPSLTLPEDGVPLVDAHGPMHRVLARSPASRRRRQVTWLVVLVLVTGILAGIAFQLVTRQNTRPRPENHSTPRSGLEKSD